MNILECFLSFAVKCICFKNRSKLSSNLVWWVFGQRTFNLTAILLHPWFSFINAVCECTFLSLFLNLPFKAKTGWTIQMICLTDVALIKIIINWSHLWTCKQKYSMLNVFKIEIFWKIRYLNTILMYFPPKNTPLADFQSKSNYYTVRRSLQIEQRGSVHS